MRLGQRHRSVRDRALTRNFKWNADLIFCDFDPIILRHPSIGVLGLGDLIPFVLGWRLFAFGLPVLTILGSTLVQYHLDTFLDVRKRFRVTFNYFGVRFARDVNPKRLVE